MHNYRRRPGPKQVRVPRSPDKTRLWHVYLSWERGLPVVTVAEEEQRSLFGCHMRIRSISANAAGRTYIRKNLAFDITSIDMETRNPCSPTYGCTPHPKLVKKRAYYKSRATIRVVKKGRQ